MLSWDLGRRVIKEIVYGGLKLKTSRADSDGACQFTAHVVLMISGRKNLLFLKAIHVKIGNILDSMLLF